jgi:hypothetical protein
LSVCVSLRVSVAERKSREGHRERCPSHVRFRSVELDYLLQICVRRELWIEV